MKARKMSMEEQKEICNQLQEHGFELLSFPRFKHNEIDEYLSNWEDKDLEFSEEHSTFDFSGKDLTKLAYIMFKKGVECGKRIKEEQIKEVLNIE